MGFYQRPLTKKETPESRANSGGSKFRACRCESEHLPAMGSLKCADKMDDRELKNLPKW